MFKKYEKSMYYLEGRKSFKEYGKINQDIHFKAAKFSIGRKNEGELP